MNYELITIITTIVLAWGSLSWFIRSSHRGIHGDIAALRERMARLEGSIDVLKDLFQASVAGRTQ